MRERLVLVTGATGYVGTVLVPLLAQKHRVRCFDSQQFGNSISETPNVEFRVGDIRNRPECWRALVGVTDVIHLAGIVTDDLADLNRHMTFEVNVQATEGLLQMARVSGVSRFLYASSSSVYGTTLQDATEDMQPLPMTFYAETKLMAERFVIFSNKPDFVTTAVRCATCAGPAPRMRLDTIVNVFSKQAFYDPFVNVHDGTQWRSNIHVKDAAEFYISLLDRPVAEIGGEVFNITGENHSAEDIAGTVAEVAKRWLHKEVEVRIDKTIRDERQYRMSYAKAQALLGWEPKRSMAKAIRENFDWFTAHPRMDPNSDLWYNTRRMKDVVMKEAPW